MISANKSILSVDEILAKVFTLGRLQILRLGEK